MKEDKPKLIKIRCVKCHSAQTYTNSKYICCRKCGYKQPRNIDNNEEE